MKTKKLTRQLTKDAGKCFIKHLHFIQEAIKNFPQRLVENEEKPERKDLPARLCPAKRNKDVKSAQTIEQLQAKLSKLKSKPGLPYKEKLVKKALKKRIKKRKITIVKNLEKEKSEKPESKTEIKKEYKPENINLNFNKIDLLDEEKKMLKKRDPDTELKKLKEKQVKWKKIEEEEGEEGRKKVEAIREKEAWQTSLKRSRGETVKDDPQLLTASLMKKRRRKQRSAMKWKANEERVHSEKQERQRKRLENIKTRAKQKKTKKLKTLTKRGKVIPGF